MNIKVYLVILVCILASATGALGGDWGFGLGLQTGVSYLEGDAPDPKLSPMVQGYLRALPIPYVAFSGELGWSEMKAGPSAADFSTLIVPFELSGIINFLPFAKVNPYVTLGGGGVFWKASAAGATLEENLDSFLKTGGGLEFRLNERLALDVGATYRMSLTDWFDQLSQGDENDQVLAAHVGMTYYFRKGEPDRDGDLIVDSRDSMPEIPEDHDGYLDHDGIPEKNVMPSQLTTTNADFQLNSSSPMVFHRLTRRAEAGRSIPLKADVYSNKELRVVAVLYRPLGRFNWNVARMNSFGPTRYEGSIPAHNIRQGTLEYCVVAVDVSLSGIGYSGLPSMPIHIDVVPSGKPWRILGGVLGAAATGTASYLVVRKQK